MPEPSLNVQTTFVAKHVIESHQRLPGCAADRGYLTGESLGKVISSFDHADTFPEHSAAEILVAGRGHLSNQSHGVQMARQLCSQDRGIHVYVIAQQPQPAMVRVKGIE